MTRFQSTDSIWKSSDDCRKSIGAISIGSLASNNNNLVAKETKNVLFGINNGDGNQGADMTELQNQARCVMELFTYQIILFTFELYNVKFVF